MRQKYEYAELAMHKDIPSKVRYEVPMDPVHEPNSVKLVVPTPGFNLILEFPPKSIQDKRIVQEVQDIMSSAMREHLRIHKDSIPS